MKKRISLSIAALVRKVGYRRALDIAREAGFDAVDYRVGNECAGFDLYGQGEDAVRAYYEEVGAYARSVGLDIAQTHGRFRTAVADAEASEQNFRDAVLDLLATAALGAPACVLHSASTYHLPSLTPEQMQSYNHCFFEALIPYAEAARVKMAQETFGVTTLKTGERVMEHYGDSRYLKAANDALNTAYKGLCLDSGHTNDALSLAPLGAGVPDPVETVYLFGKDLCVLHLNDNNRFTDQHLFPGFAGDGGVKWRELFAALDEVGYDGFYNFELALGPAAHLEQTVRYLGPYLRAFVDGEL